MIFQQFSLLSRPFFFLVCVKASLSVIVTQQSFEPTKLVFCLYGPLTALSLTGTPQWSWVKL